MKNAKLLCVLLALCALTFVLTACGEKKEPEVVNEPVQEEVVVEPVEEEIVEMPNPVVQYDSVEEAVIQVGHLCSIPEKYAGYNQSASVISGSLIQIDFSDDTGRILLLREKAGTETDISGDYNTYAYKNTFDSNGNTVTIKGDSADSIKLATWNDGAYAHSLSYTNGVSLEEIQTAVSEIN